MTPLQRMAIAEAKSLIERAKSRIEKDGTGKTEMILDDLDRAAGWLTQVLAKRSKKSDDEEE